MLVYLDGGPYHGQIVQTYAVERSMMYTFTIDGNDYVMAFPPRAVDGLLVFEWTVIETAYVHRDALPENRPQ